MRPEYKGASKEKWRFKDYLGLFRCRALEDTYSVIDDKSLFKTEEVVKASIGREDLRRITSLTYK